MSAPPATPSTEPGRRPPTSGEHPGGVSRHHGLRARLRELYHGWSPRAVRFRYGLLAFDLVTLGFVVASSFFFGHPAVEGLDLLFGVLILADFVARLMATRAPLNELMHPLGLADLIVIFSFLAPLAGENFAFL